LANIQSCHQDVVKYWKKFKELKSKDHNLKIRMNKQNNNDDPEQRQRFLGQLDEELEDFAHDLDKDVAAHTNEKSGKVNKDR